MRVLVTGSRDWPDHEDLPLGSDKSVWWTLGNLGVLNGDTVVHGACPTGADEQAGVYARMHCCVEERHPAQWDKYGKSAGFRRNAEMVALGADFLVAFIKDDSKGTTHTLDLAIKAGMATHVVRIGGTA